MRYLAVFAVALVAAFLVADVAKAGDCRHATPVVVQQAQVQYVPVQQFQAVQTYAAPVQFQAVQAYAVPQAVVVQRNVVVQRQFSGGFAAQAQFGGRQRGLAGGGGGDVIRRLLPAAGAVGGAIVGGPVGAGVGALLGGLVAGQ